MTPAERRLWLALERAASEVSPDVRAALFTLWRETGGAVSDAELLRLIARGDVQGVVDALLAAMTTPAVTQPMRNVLRSGVERAARRQARALPLPRAVTVQVTFDWLNPRILTAMRTLESAALDTLTAEAAETVRQVVTRGLAAGVGPRTLIPQLRNAIGLAPNQEAAVESFRQKLLGGPRSVVSGDVLPHLSARGESVGGAALRDKRFDTQIRRAIRTGERLTPAQVERMTTAYRKRMLAFNAETHARTAALDAVRLGQQEAFESAVTDGGFDRTRVTKRWVATLDARVRPEHRAMHGVTIPLDARFPVDGGVLLPGQNTYNCRCLVAYKVRPA